METNLQAYAPKGKKGAHPPTTYGADMPGLSCALKKAPVCYTHERKVFPFSFVSLRRPHAAKRLNSLCGLAHHFYTERQINLQLSISPLTPVLLQFRKLFLEKRIGILLPGTQELLCPYGHPAPSGLEAEIPGQAPERLHDAPDPPELHCNVNARPAAAALARADVYGLRKLFLPQNRICAFPHAAGKTPRFRKPVLQAEKVRHLFHEGGQVKPPTSRKRLLARIRRQVFECRPMDSTHQIKPLRRHLELKNLCRSALHVTQYCSYHMNHLSSPARLFRAGSAHEKRASDSDFLRPAVCPLKLNEGTQISSRAD